LAPSTITLTTDFGWTELPAAIRGVIHDVAPPGTRVVDITHSVPSHDIIQGAYAMLTTCPLYKEAVHIGVVDPGVGTKRRAIAIEAGNSFLVGPDNGLLAPLAHKLGFKRAVALQVSKYWRAPVSATFHGRDIFAPVGAHLCAGVLLEQLGTPIDDPLHLPAFEVHNGEDEIRASIVSIDKFGNLVTSIPSRLVVHELEAGQALDMRIAGRRIRPHPVAAYGEIEGRAFGAIVNSSDFVEIAMFNASAAERTGARSGDPVFLYK